MKNQILLTSLFILLTLSLSAQRSRDYALSAGSNYSGEAINIFDLREKNSPEGTFYWNEEWADCYVKLVNGKVIEGMPMKYDLQSNSLEIKVKKDIKVLPGELVEEFTFVFLNDVLEDHVEHRFVRLDLFFDKDVIDQSFYELIHKGEDISLLLKIETEILPPNYVPTQDVGSTQSKIIKKEKYVTFDGVNLLKLPKSKRKLIGLLEQYKPEVKAYFDKNKPSLKDRRDLKEIFSFCNS